MGFNPKSIAAMLENIVYFELRRRGYEVYIGKNETKEIDFVPLRTIQQYEQRQKSINKAMAERLIMLAKVLCCEVEDLIEKCE